MIDALRDFVLQQLPAVMEKVERAVGTATPAETAPVSDVETPAPEIQLIGIEDASAFVQHMAALEGQLRLEVCQEGCCCQMDVRAVAQRAGVGAVAVEVQTAHDPICPWLVNLKRGPEAD